ncbi:MAG: NDP-sugar pyrophosphorylase [Chloroflexi bacterium]|jgi:dTDP-glucose pyrophosphorylase/CBS domain-containing protein|nr:MAG: NDP-sugar pyrophosphorylase [Chloroflexota bacterium]
MDTSSQQQRIAKMTASPSETIMQALGRMDQGGMGLALVCDENHRLVGVISDGDVRRAILKGMSLQEPCLTIASADPVVALPSVKASEALRLMDSAKSFRVNHLPLVDQVGKLSGLVARRDLAPESEDLPLSVVLMAGGMGTRLMPLTKDVPKPMLPVGDRPLMEHTLNQLRQAGVRHVDITTNYLAEKIQQYFGDGKDFGVEISYVEEDRPLGTAGALGLIPPPSGPLLVINGDILTKIDFRAMLEHHKKHHADLTIASRRHDFQVPYGVVDCDGPNVLDLREKPVLNFLINAGIYLMEPLVHQYIPAGQRLDMTELVKLLLQQGRSVVSFPLVEYWLDVGQHQDYEQAQADAQHGVLG